MNVFIDMSVFASPSEPVGNITGKVSVSGELGVGARFPWPNEALSTMSQLARALLNQATIASIDASPAISGVEYAVMLSEVMCRSAEEVQTLAGDVRRSLGLVLCEY